MLDIKNLNFAISQISNSGVEAFLKSHSLFERSNVEGIYYYQSLLPTFEKFILFDCNHKEISLVFSEKNIYFSDLCKHFEIISCNYSYRDVLSIIKILDWVYIAIDGKLNYVVNAASFTDAKGNNKSADETVVKAVIIELS